MGVKPLSSAFPRLFHLSPIKNCFVSDFLVWSRDSFSFSFDLCRSLYNKETTEVASLLSSVEGFDFRLRRRDVLSGALILWRGSLVSHSLELYWTLLPLSSRSLMFYGGLRFLRKLRSPPSKFCLAV